MEIEFFAPWKGIRIEIAWWICAPGLLAIAAIWLWRWRRGSSWKAVEVEIALGKVGKVKLTPNHETLRIAHQAWAELATRKAALPFEVDHDVIAEVYESWYVLFGELRALVKSVPAEQLSTGQPAARLVEVLVQALNEGLRPHLTRWQAKYRAWWEAESTKTENHGIAPQELQRRYPEHDALLGKLSIG
jgi:hypothetical protein